MRFLFFGPVWLSLWSLEVVDGLLFYPLTTALLHSILEHSAHFGNVYATQQATFDNTISSAYTFLLSDASNVVTAGGVTLDPEAVSQYLNQLEAIGKNEIYKRNHKERNDLRCGLR